MAVYTAIKGNTEYFFNVKNNETLIFQLDHLDGKNRSESLFKVVSRRMKKQELDETFNLEGVKLLLISIKEFDEMLATLKEFIETRLDMHFEIEKPKPGFLDA